jgi:hypothetical protein
MHVTKEATENAICMCVLGVRRVKAEENNIESGASTSLQTPNKKRTCKRTAMDLWESGESVVW